MAIKKKLTATLTTTLSVCFMLFAPSIANAQETTQTVASTMTVKMQSQETTVGKIVT